MVLHSEAAPLQVVKVSVFFFLLVGEGLSISRKSFGVRRKLFVKFHAEVYLQSRSLLLPLSILRIPFFSVRDLLDIGHTMP